MLRYLSTEEIAPVYINDQNLSMKIHFNARYIPETREIINWIYKSNRFIVQPQEKQEKLCNGIV
ncbi:hypothetical protein NECAME_15774 [Necator americanus]|uniref:Uncharacterized protein n=1 Tax=Necator americanus TaxID=51031 RepID=W2SIF4_NECAM|nr:hypothetical protein NECAME_15774 [Necator americanus]ETN68537.1 hypothetical protein NECAME_15774 [Necator americanus]